MLDDNFPIISENVIEIEAVGIGITPKLITFFIKIPAIRSFFGANAVSENDENYRVMTQIIFTNWVLLASSVFALKTFLVR